MKTLKAGGWATPSWTKINGNWGLPTFHMG